MIRSSIHAFLRSVVHSRNHLFISSFLPSISFACLVLFFFLSLSFFLYFSFLIRSLLFCPWKVVFKTDKVLEINELADVHRLLMSFLNRVLTRLTGINQRMFLYFYTGACPSDWIRLNGSCYKISSDKLNWNAAKSACEAMGSELATVKSQNEQQALAPRIKEFTWIGLHRVSYDSSPLIWVDGTRPSYTNFYPGQPDHYGGYEDCVHMLLREGQVKWNDISCSLNMLFICEMNGE